MERCGCGPLSGAQHLSAWASPPRAPELLLTDPVARAWFCLLTRRDEGGGRFCLCSV